MAAIGLDSYRLYNKIWKACTPVDGFAGRGVDVILRLLPGR